MTQIYVDLGHVAGWFGITRNAATMWLERFDNCPEPDAVILLPSGREILGWLPSRREEWEKWKADNTQWQRGNVHYQRKRLPRRRYAAEGCEI